MARSLDTQIKKQRAEAIARALNHGDRQTVRALCQVDRIERLSRSELPGQRQAARAVTEQMRVILRRP
ncbi:MAG: hypothetical protein NW206_02905 [Hyphomonadaceae bacterium]|nr:hypothetical protein [Hyphomonadaceae bacterium]